MDGHANPGDTLLTHILIQNGTGTPITGVTVTDPANGTTVVAGSVLVSVDDVYSLVGNTPMSFAANQGLLTNDFNGDGVNVGNNSGLTVLSVDQTGTHGTVAFNADGSFTFTPQTGFTGDTSFTYQVTDSAGTVGSATVTMHITGEVWYVDSAASAAGADGSFLHPFTSLAPLNGLNGAGDVDGTNDQIIVHGTPGGGGIQLEAGQQLYGDGSSVIINGHQITNSGANSTITATSGVVVTLATDNTVNGVTINANGAGVVGMADNNGSVSSTTGSAGLTVAHTSFTGSGQAVDIDQGGKLNVAIDSLTSSGSSAQGVQIAGSATSGTGLLTGSFTVTGGAISGSTAEGFKVGDGVVGHGGDISVSYGGTIDKTSAGQAVDVQGHTANNVTFSGNIGATNNGGGINLANDTGGTITFSGQTINVSTGTAAGVSMIGNAGATINFTPGGGGNGLDIATSSGTGLTFTGGGTLNITGSGNSISTATGQLANLQNGSLGGGGVTFGTMTASGTVANHGIYINNLDGGAFNGGAVSIANGTSGTGNDATASDGIHIGGGSSTNFTFASATIGDATHGTAGDGVEINGTGNGTVTFTTVAINHSAGDNFLVSGSDNSVTVNGGTIGNLDDGVGADLHVLNGTGAVTMAASLTKTTAGHVVDISGHATGTIGISGNISATGAADNGISLVNNTSGQINFTGTNVTLTTGANSAINFTDTAATGAAVSFTGGNLAVNTTSGTGINAVNTNAASATTPIGSITISGANNNVTSTGGGTGVNISGVAETVTLKSVNFSGGANTAIFLQNAGNGGFTITGTGTTASSGGTISHASGGADLSHTQGDGIFLNNVGNISLSNLTFTGTFSNFGIHGTNVTNFNLDHSSLTGSYGTSSAGGNEEGPVAFDNLLGTATINNSTLGGSGASDLSFANDLRVTNTSGTLTRLTVDAVTFGKIGGTGNHDVNFSVTNSATANLTVTNSTITNYLGSGINVAVLSDATSDVVIRNNTISQNNPNAAAGSNGIKISGDTPGHTTHVSYDVSHNTVTGSVSSAVLVAKGSGKGIWSGTINANTIGVLGNTSQGSTQGDGIRVTSDGTGSHTTLISNNKIYGYNEYGIGLTAADTNSGANGATPGVFNASVFGNTTANGGSFAQAGLVADIGALSTDTTTLNLVVGSATDATKKNDFSQGDPINAGDVTLVHNTGATINLSRNGSVSATPTGVIQDDNLNGASTSVITSGTINLVNTLPNLPPVVAPLQVLPPEEKPVGDPKVVVMPDPGHTPPPVDPIVTPPPVDPVVTPPPADTTPPPPAPTIVDDGILTQAELNLLVGAAIDRWAGAGATEQQLATMRAVSVTISDIGGFGVGDATPGHIQVDRDGAGYGWFLDTTPGQDGEYHGSGTDLAANAGGPAAGKLDLLTVLMHELGHQIGLVDDYRTADFADIMYGYVNPGERRLPTAADAAAANGNPVDHESFALSPVNVGTIGTDPSATLAAQVSFQSTVNGFAPGQVPTFTSSSHVVYTGNAVGVDSNTETLSPTSSPALASLTLGDTVFVDANGNNAFDSGEGLAGVALSLFVKGTSVGQFTGGSDTDVDGDGINDQFIASTTTGVGGAYSFAGLAPGDYMVRVDAGNFTGPLAGKVSIAGGNDPDDNANNDDNGVAGVGGATVSLPITLAFDTETTPGPGNNTNNTLDFGFITPNAAPVLSNIDGDIGAFTEGGAVTRLDVAGNATLTDDQANFNGGSLTVHIGTGLHATEDQLGIDPASTVTVNGSNHVLVGATDIGTVSGGGDLVFAFNSAATPALVQTLIRALDYSNSNTIDPATDTRSISLTLVDGGGTNGGVGHDTTTVNVLVNVNAVNDEPAGADNSAGTLDNVDLVFDAASFSTGFTDPDHNAFAGVEITTLPGVGEGVIKLNGVAISAGDVITKTQLDNHELTYTPPGVGSGGTSPDFTFQVQDDGGVLNGGVDFDQSPNTFTVNITASDIRPVVDLDADDSSGATGGDFATAYTEGGTAAPVVDTDVTITDADAGDNVEGAVVSISDPQTGDQLTITGPLPGSITATGQGTDTITLSGTGTQAEYQDALKLIVYSSTSDDPTLAGVHTTRDIGVTVTDGDQFSLAHNTQVTVTGVNDRPVNNLGGAIGTGEDAINAWLSGMTISDPDAGSQDIKVIFHVGHGILDIMTGVGGGIVAGDVTGNGTDTVTVTASQSEIDATLAAVNGLTYSPTTNYNGSDTLTVTTNDLGNTGTDPGVSGDGTSEETVSTRTISISASNDAPTVAGDGTEALAAIDEDVPSPTGQSFSSILTGQYSDAADNQVPNGGASSPGAFTGVAVTVNGSGATGQWQYSNDGGANWHDIGAASDGAAVLLNASTALRFHPALDYNGPAPALTVHLIDNSLGFSITDGQIVDLSTLGATGGTTAYSTGTVDISQDVNAVNDAPTASVVAALAATEQISTDLKNTMSVGDVDAASGQVSVTVTVSYGILNASAGTSGVIVSGIGSSGVTITGTIAQVNDFLSTNATSSFGYVPDTDTPPATATLSLQIGDNGHTGSGGSLSSAIQTSTITITAVDDAAVAQPDAISTTDAAVKTGSVFTDNGSGVDSDVDGPALTVSAVNGVPADVGATVTLASGAKLTLLANGNYSYDPNGAFNSLVPLASGAVNTHATDSFNYTLANGNTVAVTVTVNGTEGAGDIYKGDSGDNTITSGGLSDTFDVSQGGTDHVHGSGGNDYFFFGNSFDTADTADGGAGTMDVVGLLGNYNMTLAATSFTGIERLTLFTGTLLGGSTHVTYTITTVDENVASGDTLTVLGNSLLSDETMVFNGSAETNGHFFMLGGAANDILVGGQQDDSLIGGAGDDQLYGLGGSDYILGGAGADTLRGGFGADFFVYQSTSDSTAASMDYIRDFENGTDKIDLSAIDANSGAPGDQAFTFIGANAFDGTAGELRAFQSAGHWFIEADTNGDMNADLVIKVDTFHPIVGTDFIP